MINKNNSIGGINNMNELFVMNIFLEQRGYNAYLKSSESLKVEGNTLFSNGSPLAKIEGETLYIDLSTQDDEMINEHRDMLVRLATTFPYPLSYLAKLTKENSFN